MSLPFFLAWYKKFEFIHVVEVEALVLSIFALIFAVKQFGDSAEVSKQLSTRFLSIFPGNLKEITTFIAQSTDNLDVMIDYAGYGIYSDPQTFSRYCDALENRARASLVRMLLYSNGLAMEALKQQFTMEFFEKTKKKPTDLERFLDQHQQLIRPKSSAETIEQMNYDTFIELQLRARK